MTVQIMLMIIVGTKTEILDIFASYSDRLKSSLAYTKLTIIVVMQYEEIVIIIFMTVSSFEKPSFLLSKTIVLEPK